MNETDFTCTNHGNYQTTPGIAVSDSCHNFSSQDYTRWLRKHYESNIEHLRRTRLISIVSKSHWMSCTFLYNVCICVNSSCTSLKWKPLEFELQILTSNLFLFMCLDPPLPPIIRERVSSISLTGINNWRVGTTSSNILLENFKDFLGKTSCIYFHNKH